MADAAAQGRAPRAPVPRRLRGGLPDQRPRRRRGLRARAALDVAVDPAQDAVVPDIGKKPLEEIATFL